MEALAVAVAVAARARAVAAILFAVPFYYPKRLSLKP